MKENKIRKQFIIRTENRGEESQKRVSKWLDAQTNYTSSVVALIEHMIERFGYVDITEHDVAKKLYQEMLYYADQKPSQIKSNNTNDEITATFEIDEGPIIIDKKIDYPNIQNAAVQEESEEDNNNNEDYINKNAF